MRNARGSAPSGVNRGGDADDLDARPAEQQGQGASVVRVSAEVRIEMHPHRGNGVDNGHGIPRNRPCELGGSGAHLQVSTTSRCAEDCCYLMNLFCFSQAFAISSGNRPRMSRSAFSFVIAWLVSFFEISLNIAASFGYLLKTLSRTVSAAL